MTKGNKQNGRQPPVSQVSAPSTDPRCKNPSALSSDRDKVCRDFIWGICIKGARCAYRHERDLDHMKTVLKFCHDFQNKSGCLRPDCTYLHTTRDEQNQFLNKGRIPKVLADRYAAMAVASTSGSEVVSQMTINGESMSMQTDDATLVPGNTQQQQPQTAAFSQLLLKPPPPPPPTLVTTTVQTTSQNISTTAIPQVPKVTLNQPPPQLPAIFDVSRPPPQIPQQITGSQKRPAELIEAGPCKARKQEAPKEIETLCDICVQRELRIELLQDDNQKLQTQKDYKALLIDKNNEEYEHAKLIMRPLVKPELYQILAEYLEKLPSDLVDSEALLQMNPTPSPVVMSNSAKALMKHLLDRVITNGTNNVLDAQPTTNGISEDPSLSPLSTLARPKSGSVENSAVELIQTLLFIYKGSVDNESSDKNLTIDSNLLQKFTSELQPSTSGISSSVISELTHYLNGQNDQNLRVVTTNGTLNPTGVVSPSHSNSVDSGSKTVIPFQPTVPPPVIRPMFPPPTAANTPNISNKTVPNTMVVPPLTSTMRSSKPIVHPPKPTMQSPVPVRTPVLTPTEQTPAITTPPPTLARQSTSMPMSVSIQRPKVTQDPTVVQSPRMATPLASQQQGSAKRFGPQNGQIFVPKNGVIPPRPNFFPPFQ